MCRQPFQMVPYSPLLNVSTNIFMIYRKPPQNQAAFTLLELIIVIAITAILAAYILTRSHSSGSYQQDSVVEQIISAGRLAQQFAMNDSARAFSLSIQANQIDLYEDSGSGDVSISPGSINFPLDFGSTVTLTPTSKISYDRQGTTTAITISVKVDSITKDICFESSGYIHRC